MRLRGCRSSPSFWSWWGPGRASAAPSKAGPPGKWTVISGGGVTNIVEPGLYRTADGTLHVAMHRNAADFTVELHRRRAHHRVRQAHRSHRRHRRLGGGRRSTPCWSARPTAACAWCSAASVRGDPADPYGAGYLWQTSSPADGLSWTLSPTAGGGREHRLRKLGLRRHHAGRRHPGRGVPGRQRPSTTRSEQERRRASTWPTAAPTTSRWRRTPASCTPRGTPTGTASANMGQFVRTIYPTLGPIMKVPGSTSTFSGSPGSIDPSQRVAMTTRNGGGVYIALCKGYPTCDSVVLWKVGTTKLLKVPGSKDASHVSISPAPSGRLWIAFDDTDDNLHAVRTNTTAKKFGARAHDQAAQAGRRLLPHLDRGHPRARRPALQRRRRDLAPADLRRPHPRRPARASGTATSRWR